MAERLHDTGGISLLDRKNPSPYDGYSFTVDHKYTGRERLYSMEFQNPLLPRGQDPFVTFHDGSYHYIHAGSPLGPTPLYVSTADSLTGLRYAQAIPVWTPQESGEATTDIWAPEIHFLDDNWWLYVAAWSGVHGDPHRMYVLEGGKDPREGFSMKADLTPAKTPWGIDGTILKNRDKTYYVWSGKEKITVGESSDPLTHVDTQHLFISEMKSPWEFTGPTQKIATPTFEWEITEPQPVNEGPEVLQRNGRTIVVYSAGHALTDDYCLGMIVNDTNDFLNPEMWHKFRDPIFCKTPEVFGPGHPSFTTTKDGKEDWIIYHSAQHSGSGFDRQVNAQPFTWSTDGFPIFGSPVSPREKIVDTTGKPAASKSNYLPSHTQQRVGIPQHAVVGD